MNKINLMINLINLQFNSFGKYEIELLVDDNKIGSTFLEVSLKKS